MTEVVTGWRLSSRLGWEPDVVFGVGEADVLKLFVLRS